MRAYWDRITHAEKKQHLLQLCVINIRTESIFYRVQINLSVSCDLHAIANPASTIFHELMRPSAIRPPTR